MGFFSSNLIEVEASIEMPVAGRFVARAKPSVPQPRAAKSEAIVASTASQTNSAIAVVNQPTTEVIVLPQTKVLDSHDADEQPLITHDSSHSNSESQPRPNRVATDGGTSRLPPAMYETLSEMLDAGVEPTEAKSLLQAAAKMLEIEQLNDTLLLQARIGQLVSKNLHVAEPIAVQRGQQAVVAMIGTTGVGKTTTLAKLATNFQMDHNCQVGLITMDTLRPGAVDQLLQYAESLNAALEVVSSASQFLPALHRLKDCDVVFIDTAGRSPNDAEQIRVLQGLLEAAQPTSVQLVVSATSSVGHVQAALEKFSPLKPTGMLITKLDEAIGFGAWLSILQHCDLPVSYLTYGQHVPHDFSVANRRRLASLLLGHANANS
jgi:flagellar biosynthesis protein FlhF